jgi:type III pantothenate kinase
MLLVIDVGNTRIKAAVFKQNTVVMTGFFLCKDYENEIENLLAKYQEIQNICVSSVGSLKQDNFQIFEKRAKITFITSQSKFPFQNLYQSPTTLGIDRMILATGAVLQFPNQNRLVIDAGTCITYDFIDENDRYLGGAISPGIQLRYQSLHQHTSRLPLLEREMPEGIIGNTTSQAIHSGVVNGLVNEIDGFINEYKSKNANIIIILTGGDSDFLAKRLKNAIFAHSNFLLESLNKTFQYNQK